MLSGARITVVVPAFDESEHIEQTLRSMPAFVDRIVVVDDASTDGTAEIAEWVGQVDRRVVVFRHATNRGVGASIATGYQLAFAEGTDVAAVMAGDGQMHPDDLSTVVLAVTDRGADYAKGDRFAWPNAAEIFPLARYAGGRLFTWLTRVATGLAVNDSQCGFTALSHRAATRLDLAALWPRYGYPNDLLGLAAEAGLVVRDVTVRPVYAGEASGLRARDVVTMIARVLARVAMRRLARATKSAWASLWATIARPRASGPRTGRARS